MFAIYTTDFCPPCMRRMPWRTVLELSREWSGVVYSAGGGLCGRETEIDGVRVLYVCRPFGARAAERFANQLKNDEVSRLYFPIASGRSYKWLQKYCDQLKIELVWYMPGSWNSFRRIWRAARVLGLGTVRSYLLQALVPKRSWVKRLCRQSVRHLITMTPFTAEKMIECGYPKELVHPILPGLDPIPRSRTFEYSNIRTISKPYFLFFGPPHAIRGVYLILEAVKKLVDIRTDFEVVMLVRADDNAQAALIKLKNEIGKPVYDGIVHAVYDILPAKQIEEYVRGCVAVLKPFVLVPSEVPLAVMEAMQAGKRIIGFAGDGTGELIARRGIVVKHGDVDALAKAMERILDADEEGMREEEEVTFSDWNDVARKWKELR